MRFSLVMQLIINLSGFKPEADCSVMPPVPPGSFLPLVSEEIESPKCIFCGLKAELCKVRLE